MSVRARPGSKTVAEHHPRTTPAPMPMDSGGLSVLCCAPREREENTVSISNRLRCFTPCCQVTPRSAGQAEAEDTPPERQIVRQPVARRAMGGCAWHSSRTHRARRRHRVPQPHLSGCRWRAHTHAMQADRSAKVHRRKLRNVKSTIDTRCPLRRIGGRATSAVPPLPQRRRLARALSLPRANVRGRRHGE